LKKERVKTLIELGEIKLNEFAAKMIGRDSEVLFEREKDGYFEGYTSNFVKVKIKSEENLKNQIKKLKLSEMVGDKLVGEQL
jgi:threonylcarbamoyladenosine tRNA methylthiotransferase MtaB